MVRTRVMLGSALAAFFALLAWLDTLMAAGPLVHIVFGLVMVGTLLEFYALAGRQGSRPLKLIPVGLVVIFVALDYMVGVANVSRGALPVVLPGSIEALRRFYAMTGMGAAVGVWVVCIAQLLARDPKEWLASAPVAAMGLLYVWFLGAHLFPIRAMGMGYVVAVFAAAKLGDVGAYSVGTRWGRHRLAPRVSPKKTVEGALGGLAASVAGSVAVALAFRLHGSVGYWLLFGVVVGIAAQLGDLVASAVKRSAGAKDSGQLVPTFGGLLDIADSVLFSAPAALWFLVA